MDAVLYDVPVYGIQLVRESVQVTKRESVSCAKDVFQVVQPMIGNKDREHLLGVYLDTKNHVLGISTISIGALNSSISHPREIFKTAILLNACAFVLIHNHPSGDITPSEDDHAMTKRIEEAGKLLGIPLLDHIIVSFHDGYYSYKDNNKL